MSRRQWFRSLAAAVITLCLAVPACAPRIPPQPEPLREDTVFVRVVPDREYPAVDTVQIARLTKVHCPGGTGETQTRSIGPDGGVLTLRAGHSLEVPAGAVQAPTPFTLTDVRHDRHLRVNAYARGDPRLGRSASLTISFERCDTAQTENRLLRIVRERRSGPADDVGGERVPERRALRAELDRLSGYAVTF
jgi:hypothetical protein